MDPKNEDNGAQNSDGLELCSYLTPRKTERIDNSDEQLLNEEWIPTYFASGSGTRNKDDSTKSNENPGELQKESQVNVKNHFMAGKRKTYDHNEDKLNYLRQNEIVQASLSYFDM